MSKLKSEKRTRRSLTCPALSRAISAVALVAAAFSGPAALAAEPTATRLTAVRAARMLDVETGRFIENPVIVIERGRVKEAGANIAVPVGAEVVDLGNTTVLPGLIDTHVHLASAPPTAGTAKATMVAYRNAMTTLRAGFTSVRNMGGPAFIGIALRDSIANGDVPGPRVFDAGTLLSVTGGHCSGPVPSAEQNENDESGTANGADAFERKVRQQFRQGADFIKACITGGFNSGTDPRVTQFSEAELKSVIDTAHRYGKKVAVHAHGPDAIKLATKLGADSVEHASLVDDEGIRLLLANKTTIVPTLAIAEVAVKRAIAAGATGSTLSTLQETSRVRRANVAKAIRAGVPVMFGTDAPVLPHGTNATEFAYLVEAGLTPLQAIQAATIKAAAWLNAGSDIGSIAPGKVADLIAVKDDPIANIRTLESVDWVIKGGEVVKRPAPQSMLSPSSK